MLNEVVIDLNQLSHAIATLDSKDSETNEPISKNLKRDRGLHQGVYLITGDKDMASLATLENQASFHIGAPRLDPEVNSVRYDSYNQRFVLTPIHYLLWDFAQVFSTIRFESKDHSCKYELVYYSQARGGFC